MSILRKAHEYLAVSAARRQNLLVLRRALKHTIADGGLEIESRSSFSSGKGYCNSGSWKKIDSRSLEIQHNAIEFSARLVLKILKQKGFQSYLVGGCVRDLLLHKTPKDFDVVTTADLKTIRKHFHRTLIIGRRFPICLVYIKNSCIEVSSFDASISVKDRSKSLCPQTRKKCDQEDIVRWTNCMRRDFTINSLLYDPFTHTIYDYANGIEDIKACKVRTIIPAHLSFKEDCARILRGIRVAARLGLNFSKETKASILDLSSSITSLPKERLMMEMNYMLAYGAAVPSIYLLKRFKLLEILLPLHDLYLLQQAKFEDGDHSMLIALLYNMDMILSADHPCDCKLWLSLLAFHMALIECPQDALTLWTFSSILHYGSTSTALKHAKDNAKVCPQYYPEISGLPGTKSDELIMEEVSHFVSLIRSSVKFLVNSDALQQAIERLQMPSLSSLVFVSRNMGKSVTQIVDVFNAEISSSSSTRKEFDINYYLLKKGEPKEIRFVLGKIIINVLNSDPQQMQKMVTTKKEKPGVHGESRKVNLRSRANKQSTVESIMPEEKNDGTNIFNEVNLEYGKEVSKKGKGGNEMNNELKKVQINADSKDTKEHSQITDSSQQGKNDVISKTQQSKNAIKGIKHVNQLVLTSKSERNEISKKLMQEKDDIKLESCVTAEHLANRNIIKKKTKKRKTEEPKEKNEPKPGVVNEKKLSALFR